MKVGYILMNRKQDNNPEFGSFKNFYLENCKTVNAERYTTIHLVFAKMLKTNRTRSIILHYKVLNQAKGGIIDSSSIQPWSKSERLLYTTKNQKSTAWYRLFSRKDADEDLKNAVLSSEWNNVNVMITGLISWQRCQ